MGRRGWTRGVVTVAVAASFGCANWPADGPVPGAAGTGSPAPTNGAEETPTAPFVAPPRTPRPAPTSASPAPTPSSEQTTTEAAGTPVSLRVESWVEDIPTDVFRDEVEAILTDARGWQRAGFRFRLDEAVPPYLLVLAEGPEVDELCLPLDTYGRYSCQNGPVVALNADRWRTATPEWTSTLEAYRIMLVNHEVGHLLHLHHPLPQCPGEGLPAPVMTQQSTELGACTANPWPLQWEVDLAAEQREPLAPPAEHDTRDHQPSPPPATE